MTPNRLCPWPLCSLLIKAVLCLALITINGCAHKTTITTTPPNGEVWVNFVKLGEAPVDWEAGTGLPETYHVRVALKGHNTVRNFLLEKSYHADWSLLWLIPGIVPYFFTASLEPETVIQLEPETFERPK